MTMYTKKKTVDPWRNKNVYITATIAVLFLLSFVMFNGQYSYSHEGHFTKRTNCYDSDDGKDYTKKGSVVILDNSDNGVASIVREDFCESDYLVEHYCNV